jgi:hypothetical protein
MVESDGNPQTETDSAPFETPLPVVESVPAVGGSWRLPEGIEDHIESGAYDSTQIQ